MKGSMKVQIGEAWRTPGSREAVARGFVEIDGRRHQFTLVPARSRVPNAPDWRLLTDAQSTAAADVKPSQRLPYREDE